MKSPLGVAMWLRPAIDACIDTMRDFYRAKGDIPRTVLGWRGDDMEPVLFMLVVKSPEGLRAAIEKTAALFAESEVHTAMVIERGVFVPHDDGLPQQVAMLYVETQSVRYIGKAPLLSGIEIGEVEWEQMFTPSRYSCLVHGSHHESLN